MFQYCHQPHASIVHADWLKHEFRCYEIIGERFCLHSDTHTKKLIRSQIITTFIITNDLINLIKTFNYVLCINTLFNISVILEKWDKTGCKIEKIKPCTQKNETTFMYLICTELCFDTTSQLFSFLTKCAFYLDCVI